MTNPAKPSIAVEFRNVSFTFEEHQVLKDVSFAMRNGEMLILLSGSGGGKSTILKLVLGLIKPDQGRIFIEGEDITDLDEEKLDQVRKKIGIDFQEGALFDSLSVYDNVAFRLHEAAVPEDQVEKEVRRLLGFIDMEDAMDLMPAELSGGMRVRVGIARALVGKPSIILYDEPTAGLDPPTARKVLELAAKLRDLEPVSSIFVTHEMDDVRFLAKTCAWCSEGGEVQFQHTGETASAPDTRILMLRDGRAIFEGASEELFQSQNPSIHDFVHGFDAVEK